MNSKQAKELAKELAKTIIARILLLTKSEQFSGNIYAVLVVEGGTDETFVNKLKIQNVKCIAISGVVTAEEALKKNYYNFGKEKQIDKENSDRVARRDVLNTVAVLNYGYKKYAKFYGLVDKDFTADTSNGNILVTPTHDLETLLMSTDENIFETPEKIKESFNIALYVAYLIGIVEKELLDNGYRYRKLRNNDYGEIIVLQKLGEDADLRELIDFERLLDLSIDGDNKLKIKREVEQSGILDVESDDVLKGYIDDLYDVANGHDISNIMKLLCEDDIDDFIRKHNAEEHGHRAVEFAIINKYNPKSFKNCPLHQDMIRKGLVPTAI